MSRLANVLVAALLCAGCGGTREWSVVDGDGDVDGDDEDRGPGGDEPGGDGDPADDDFCADGGPLVPIPASGGTVVVDVCTGAIAERVFGHALCSCQSINVAGFLETRALDSSVDPDVIFVNGAAVGVNTTYFTTGYADVGGSFVISGDGGLTFGGYLNAGGDLSLGGNVTAVGYIEVARDAWLEGAITVPGYTEVHRDVHQTAGRSNLTVMNIHGQHLREPVEVAPPCPCGPGEIIDVLPMIEDARVTNDNGTIGLDPGVLSNVIGTGIRLELPCGKYFLDSIGGIGQITLDISSHVAIFVAGDINAVGALEVELGGDGSLDLFIGGNLVTIGSGSFGERSRPAATRIYIGGDRDVLLIGASEFVGNVYAPRARITAPGAAFVYGSLFGREIDIPGYLTVRYDLAILEVGEDCGEEDDPDTCDRCDNSCPGNRACVGNECIDCREDADCCPPLSCWPDGSCGPLML